MAKKNNRKSGQPPVEEVEELTKAEQFSESIKPHIKLIAILVVGGTLCLIGAVFLWTTMFAQGEDEWRALATASSVSYTSQDFTTLDLVSTDYVDTKVGLWALQMSADNRLQKGVSEMLNDKVAAMQLLEKAEVDFQTIVDAPQTIKTSMLHRRSLFSLSYCLETQGKLTEARKYYDQLIADAGDSAFADLAVQGLERTSDEQYAAIFEKFKNYEEVEIGETPGPELPNRPLIELPPELESPNNDFVPPVKLNTIKEPADTDKPSEDKPSEDKPSEDKPSEDKPAEDKPAATEGALPDAEKKKTP